MRGTSSACGSVTIINAISTGKGAAFAIDLRVHSTVDLEEGCEEVSGKVDDSPEDTLLIETCVERTLDFFGVENYGGEVKTTADLPIAAGLSSSSAAANATVLATASALGKELESEVAIKLGIDAAFEAGTTVTGAYDDASASFYGGGVITDNRERKILKRFSVDPDLSVLIFLPPEKSYTSESDFRRTELISELVEIAYEEAFSGNLYGAQTLNGLLYSSVLNHDPLPAVEALEAGALSSGLSGTGPSIAAICEKEKVDKVKEKWIARPGDVIETRPSEKGAETT